jgi:hypothetical protein
MAEYTADFKYKQWFAVLDCHGGKWTSTGTNGYGFSFDPWYIKI